jgi:hypothetical protein
MTPLFLSSGRDTAKPTRNLAYPKELPIVGRQFVQRTAFSKADECDSSQDTINKRFGLLLEKQETIETKEQRP